MTTQKAVVPAAERKPQAIREWLEKNSGQVALPKGIDLARLAFQTRLAINKNPALATCTTESILASVLHIASLGLYPGPEAHLVPFKDECVPILDYKGIVHLVIDSGHALKVESRVVRQNDVFKVNYGTSPSIQHDPMPGGHDTRQPTHVYAVVTLQNGETQFDVMDMEEVKKIQARSPSVRTKRGSPWDTDFDEMAKKTVVKRLLKLIPKASLELSEAVEFDDRIDTGKPPQWNIVPRDIDPALPKVAAQVDEETREAPDPEKVKADADVLYESAGRNIDTPERRKRSPFVTNELEFFAAMKTLGYETEQKALAAAGLKNKDDLAATGYKAAYEEAKKLSGKQ